MQSVNITNHALPGGGQRRRPAASNGLVAGLLLALALPFASASAASLAFDENRYIIEPGRSKQSVMINNRGNEDALVQVSLDWNEDGRDDDVPLAVSRPLRQIAAGDSTVVEVFYEGVGLPQDRESAFLLNILDVPRIQETDSDMQVRIAARHRLKLFYRPKLEQPPSTARDALRWHQEKDDPPGSVRIENTSPYFVTMVDIAADNAAGITCGNPVAHVMVAPYSTIRQPIPACHDRLAHLRYRYVTDSGRELRYAVALQTGAAVAVIDKDESK